MQLNEVQTHLHTAHTDTHSGSEVTAPSLSLGGGSMDASLFIDTQLGSGSAAFLIQSRNILHSRPRLC